MQADIQTDRQTNTETILHDNFNTKRKSQPTLSTAT